ncbi:MAG: CHAT domain-containing protein [Cyclobacteriaceae bacterium]|nr:CHAT domain-containing protein [Cyclobacteriaceae bacterium]
MKIRASCFLRRVVVMLLFFFSAEVFAQDFTILYKKLDSLYYASNFEACLELEPRIIPQIVQREDTLVANVYFYIGDAYRMDYNTKQAISYFTKERLVREKILPIDPAGYSNSLYNLMYTYAQAGNMSASINIGETLIDFDQTTYGLESDEFIFSIGDYADFLLQSNRWQLAEIKLKDAMSSLPKDSKYFGLVEARLAYVYNFSGLYRKAERSYQTALPSILDAYGEESREYQLTLGGYATLLMNQGKFDRAEELLTSTVTAIQQSNWEEKDYLYYNALNNLSLAYQSLGQYASAETSFEAILSSDSIALGVNHPDFAITLSNLGQLYTDERKFEQSEGALLSALETLRSSGEGNSISSAIALNNLARNYEKWGKHLQAIPLLEEALKIFESELGKKSPEYATALFNLGVANLSVNPSVGYAYLKKAANTRKKTLGARHPVYAETLEKLSVYNWKKRNRKEVRKLMRELFANYYFQADDFFPVLTEEEKSNLYFSKIKPSQEYYASWVIQEEINNPEELGELYSITLNTKGLILYATDKVRQRIFQSGDASLIELYEDWESQKELLAFYYSQNTASRQLDSLIQSSRNLEKELSRRSAVFSREIIRPKVTWQEVQKALKPGEAAIEVVRFRKYEIDSLQFGKNISYAMLILTSETKNGPELVLMDNGDVLEDRFLSYYRNGIQFKIENEYSYGNYWETIHDALRRLNATTIYLSTDGVYNMLSIGSIKNPFSQKYLIEELDIRLVISTRDLLQPPPKKSTGQSSLLLGFPTYNLPGALGQPNVIAAQKTGLVSRSIRGALSRFARGQNGIAPLPGTKKEVEKISIALSSSNPQLLTEKDATEANLKKVSNPGILHIATHGYFLEDNNLSALRTPNPLLNSGLILAGANNFIKDGENPLHIEEDGILTAYEAMNLNLDETQFVVLSACETALGVVQNGEGVYGLQRAFQLAGAKQIIMSLWPVDDEATQVLMSKFYNNWSESGDVRSAFRQAQLETKELYPSPYFWGAFILVGR